MITRSRTFPLRWKRGRARPVFLRTIFELNKAYGFTKFTIVVPSVAIREGILSSIETMRDHFRGLYDNVPFDHFDYNPKTLRHFQIMIINVQAFQKDAGKDVDYSNLTEEEKKLNIIHRDDDKSAGYRWIEYVHKTRLFGDNYLYTLAPIQAYNLRLVKQTEIWSRDDAENFNETYIRLDSMGILAARRRQKPRPPFTRTQ